MARPRGVAAAAIFVPIFLAVVQFRVCGGCFAFNVSPDQEALQVDDTEAGRKFLDFEKQFGKVYLSQTERQIRYETFISNLLEIYIHNNRSDVTYQRGINQFSDLSDKEFKDQYLQGYKPGAENDDQLLLRNSQLPPSNVVMGELPVSVDWREKEGVISPVKNQGHCGSCWAFATVEQIESYYAIGTGKSVQLAPQQIVSCMTSTNGCGGGCRGATATMAFSYATVYGLVKESVYPYTSGTHGVDGNCSLHTRQLSPDVSVDMFAFLPRNDMQAVMHHLAHVGPLAVSIDASAFKDYQGGIFDLCGYNNDIHLSHVVQLVGYGTDPERGSDYWLVRNSWGKTFGENGYIRLMRQKEIRCGFDTRPQNGIGCNSGSEEPIKICGTCGMFYDVTYPIGVKDF